MGTTVAVGDVFLTKGREEIVWKVASVKDVRRLGRIVTFTAVDGTGRMDVRAAEIAGRFKTWANWRRGGGGGQMMSEGVFRILVAAVIVFGSAMHVAGAEDVADVSLADPFENYLMTHPDVLKRALVHMRNEERRQAVTNLAAALVDGAVGDGKGDVTLVEYLDYNCGFCKGVAATVDGLLVSDGRLRVLYRMHPILGDDSVFAARFVIAAKEQGRDKVMALHRALMGFRGHVGADVVEKLAGEAGIDVGRARERMDAVGSAIEASVSSAKGLGIGGTPAFVLGDEVFGGVVSAEVFAARIKTARGAASGR